MKIETSFETFKKLAKLKKPVAISAILQAKHFTPLSLFENAYHYFGNGFLFEITHDASNKILMGFEPRGSFRVKNQVCEANLDGKKYIFNENALDALRKFKTLANVEMNGDVYGLTGGIVGLVSYEAIRLFEEKLKKETKESSIPEFLFYCYKINLVFDLNKKKIFLSIVTHPESDLEKSYKNAIDFLKKLQTILAIPSKNLFFKEYQCDGKGIESDISDNDYKKLVEKAKSYIRQGEIFQVVLSRTFKKAYQVPPFQIYQTLRKVTPAPYLFYMDNGENIILGASPEKLVSVENNSVETVPIAGTCKNSDQKTIDALLKDEKELAEHMMLIDLARNDLGKICIPGSIDIESLLKPKKAGNLVHLTSVVHGKLSDSFDALDALKAVFPAGTVSGAPKIRAMEIIDELEATSRGFYAGTLCFIDNHGNLDSALIIRTMVLKNGIATVRAGAGIVFDSIPEKEAKESEAKAASILRAIQLTEEESSHVTTD